MVMKMDGELEGGSPSGMSDLCKPSGHFDLTGRSNIDKTSRCGHCIETDRYKYWRASARGDQTAGQIHEYHSVDDREEAERGGFLQHEWTCMAKY